MITVTNKSAGRDGCNLRLNPQYIIAVEDLSNDLGSIIHMQNGERFTVYENSEVVLSLLEP